MSNDDDDTPVHVKSMFVGGEKDSPYLYACHLAFKDLTLTIDKVKGGEVVGTGGKKTGKPVIYWREKDARPLALNKTNGAQITSLYGTANVKEWKGKRVTLYPTNTTFGKDTVECIRVLFPRITWAALSLPSGLCQRGIWLSAESNKRPAMAGSTARISPASMPSAMHLRSKPS